MLNCKNCIKSDVCGKKKEIEDLLETLMVNPEYQTLINRQIRISMECENFLPNTQTKVLRGE